MFLSVSDRYVGAHLDGHQNGVSIQTLYIWVKVSPHILHKKTCCDLNLGESLWMFAFLEDQGGPPTWRLNTKLYTFEQRISTNISTLGQRAHLKLGELSSLFIVYNITISCPYLLHVFFIFFLIRDNAYTLCSYFNYCIQ